MTIPAIAPPLRPGASVGVVCFGVSVVPVVGGCVDGAAVEGMITVMSNELASAVRLRPSAKVMRKLPLRIQF